MEETKTDAAREIQSKVFDKSIAVVVPVYNSEPILPELCDQLAATLPELASRFELILVNDGSRDNSWDVICQLVRARDWVHGINLMRNYGQQNALLCGIRAAKYEVIVTMDDDLQHPPEEISKLLGKLIEGYDVVYGVPHKRQHGLWRNIGSEVTKLVLQRAMGAEIGRNVSAFRAFRAQVREAFSNYQGPFVSIDVLLTWGASRFAAIPVSHHPRRTGESNYTFRKLVLNALDLMTGFSTMPLQLAGLIGFAFTIFGVGVLGFVVGRYLIQGGSVPGFPFLASIIAIFSGAQLFALGVIGEYLARMHFRMMERPPYVIQALLEPDRSSVTTCTHISG
jgi:glycosyltransferase involved in cell wall biosynthesis